jgi:hypothetical protein
MADRCQRADDRRQIIECGSWNLAGKVNCGNWEME